MKKFNTVHCLFEQSGTFKNVFKNLGIVALDYDIENQFKETNVVIDLFKEINYCYNGFSSIFDYFYKGDLVIAFFPCTRFENQISLWFRGDNSAQKNWNLIKKLDYCIKLEEERSNYYILISKLVKICLDKDLQLIIENPYSEQHYLTRYWCIKPTIIDYDRTKSGDFYKKPTQYWFINCQPNCNLNNDFYYISDTTKKVGNVNGISRSLISPYYVENFIKSYIL